MVRHLNYHAMKRVGFDYEEMRQDLADLRLSPSNPSGFGIWICNLYTLNSSDVEPVAAWVGLPIDESDMDELLDVLSGDGGDYYIADTRAPTSGLADQIANMHPRRANELAQMHESLSSDERDTFAAAMSIVDFGPSNYPTAEVLQKVQSGQIKLIDKNDMDIYLDRWLLKYFSPTEWREMIINHTGEEGILLILENRRDGFTSFDMGGSWLVSSYTNEPI